MKRRTRLRTKTSLRRYTPLRDVSSRKAQATGRPKPARRDTGPDRSTRELVKERDDWSCAVCGRSLLNERPSIHHRRNRGKGGSKDPAINRPSNLLLVCGDGTSGCHGMIGDRPAWAEPLGYAVSLNARIDPVDVPVRHAVHGLVWLLDDGTVQPVAHAGGEAA